MNEFADIDEPDRGVVEMFMQLLDVDQRVAAALVDAGLTTIDEVAYIPLQELLEISEITQTLLLSLRELARQRILDDTMGRAQ
jgi:N utilization substance protein A